MSVIGSNILAGASGSAGEEALYVDDVFSTYLYTGDGNANSVQNGIDLLNEGGLVWRKNRNDGTGQSHFLHDTERSPQSGMPTAHRLSSDTSNQQFSDNDYITSWNSDGFTYGTGNSGLSGSGQDVVSWTFRKAPGFFDVVTYNGPTSGNTPQDIPHNLGVVPAVIIVKSTSNAYPWYVYHKDLGADKYLQLETDDSVSTDVNIWDNTTPTATTFRVGNNNAVNTNNGTHVAYLFAHDDQSFGTNSDEAIIKCDQYVGAGSGTVKEVDLGFEPQWLMIKKTDGAENWMILDNMRGVHAAGGSSDHWLVPNLSDAESVSADRVRFTPTGFELYDGNMSNESGKTFIYVAIRRPNKPLTAATDVFAIDTKGSTEPGVSPGYRSNFVVDMFLRRNNDGGTANTVVSSRLTQAQLTTETTNSEAGSEEFDYNNGFEDSNTADSNKYAYMFRRAPGFLDVVAYNGSSSSAQTIQHNLGAVPEMMIVKKRSASDFWAVYHSGIGNNAFLRLNTDADKTTPTVLWDTTTPTATQFTVGNDGAVNDSGATYIAYLFATLSGVSKVGTYDGTGNNVDVDCGFAAGARFVMIKRTDIVSSGDWYIWDTARGIVSGNDPYFLLNSTAAEVTNTDYIDPLNAGFTVTSSAPAALNASGGTYAFFAIS